MSHWRPGPAWLFCPADRIDRVPKALAAADVVILDLEDAVAPDRREEARAGLRRYVAESGLDPDRVVLRINAAGTADHEPDRVLAAELDLARVMVAKSESVESVTAIPCEVILLLETPRGIAHADELCAAENTVAVMWGADDLIAGLGGTSSRFTQGPRAGQFRDIARHARASALIAGKSHGRFALDSVHMDIPDLEGLRAECEDAVAIGFDATVAIHPSQIEVIRQAYTPSEERVSWARRLLSQVGDDRGVTTFEGQMVDGPIYAQAERLLQRAQTIEVN